MCLYFLFPDHSAATRVPQTLFSLSLPCALCLLTSNLVTVQNVYNWLLQCPKDIIDAPSIYFFSLLRRMSKDKNRTSSSKHGHPATENTLRDTKRKFSDMLDETKDVIVEEKANSSQSIKVSADSSTVSQRMLL